MSAVPVVSDTFISDCFKILVGAFLALQIIQEYYRRQRLHLLPTPPGASAIFGHERDVFFNPAGSKFLEWFQLLGPVYRIKGALSKPDVLVVGDPSALAHILHNVYDYPHSSLVQDRIARILGRGLGWCEDRVAHKKMRTLLAPCLFVDTIRNGAYKVFQAVSTLHETLADQIQGSSSPVEIDIMDHLNATSMDIIGQFAFAHDFGGGRDEDARNIIETWKQMGATSSSSKGFNAILMLRMFPWLEKLPLRAIKAQSHVRLRIHAGIARELLNRDKTMGKNNDGTDLLSLLMKTYHKGELTQEELMDHIATFIMGGSDSTAQSVGFALWQLAKSPATQDRLREEVAARPHASFDDLQNKMPYLDAVIREALRLSSPLAYHERIAASDDILPLRHPVELSDGSVITELPVRKGQAVQIPMISINRLGWPDGEIFRPERWMEPLPPSDLLPRGWSHTLVFGDGPRVCIGYRLAIFEMKAIVATLVRSFRFSDTGKAIDFKVAVVSSAYVKGEEQKGPQLPLYISVV